MLILIILIFVIVNKKKLEMSKFLPSFGGSFLRRTSKRNETGTEDREGKVMTHKEKEPAFRNI